jgi:hypothetical protein
MWTLRRFGARQEFVHDLVQRALLEVKDLEQEYECPVCHQVDVAVRDVITHGGEDIGRTMCLPHIRLALRGVSPAQVRACTISLATRLDSLSRNLSELIRKNDYRFSGEPLGEEKDSWLRALTFFGSEKCAG